MTPELYSLLFLGLLAAIVAAGVELRASLKPPECPRCVHCRLLAAERRKADARREAIGRLWGDDPDDRDRDGRP